MRWTTKSISQGFYASTTAQIFPEQQARYLKAAFNSNLRESEADRSCSPVLILTYCCEAATNMCHCQRNNTFKGLLGFYLYRFHWIVWGWNGDCHFRWPHCETISRLAFIFVAETAAEGDASAVWGKISLTIGMQAQPLKLHRCAAGLRVALQEQVGVWAPRWTAPPRWFLRALTLCFAFFPGCACELMSGSFTSSAAPTAPPTFDVQNCFLQVLGGIFFPSSFQIICISSFKTPPSEWSIFIVPEQVFDGDLLVVVL